MQGFIRQGKKIAAVTPLDKKMPRRGAPTPDGEKAELRGLEAHSCSWR